MPPRRKGQPQNSAVRTAPVGQHAPSNGEMAVARDGVRRNRSEARTRSDTPTLLTARRRGWRRKKSKGQEEYKSPSPVPGRRRPRLKAKLTRPKPLGARRTS